MEMGPVPAGPSECDAENTAPVRKFFVHRGDHVKQGQLLAELENRDLVAAAAESKSAIDQANSNLRATEGATIPDAMVKAQSDLEAARQSRDATKKLLDSREQLFKEGALAGRQVDESRLAYTQAQSQYQAAEEHLKTLQGVGKEEQIKSAAIQVQTAKAHYQSQEAQLAYSRVISPMAGVVADRPLNEGEIAAPGVPLMTIMDISRIVARVNVPQGDASSLKVGQNATITQTDSSEQTEGKVTVVSPSTDPNTTTVQVWIQIPNTGERRSREPPCTRPLLPKNSRPRAWCRWPQYCLAKKEARRSDRRLRFACPRKARQTGRAREQPGADSERCRPR